MQDVIKKGGGANSKAQTLTRVMDAANANVAYTGFGFSPKGLNFVSELPAKSMSISFPDLAAQYSVLLHGAAPTYGLGTECIILYEDGTKQQKAVLNSLDVDGFTLAWTKVGTPASTNGKIVCNAIG